MSIQKRTQTRTSKTLKLALSVSAAFFVVGTTNAFAGGTTAGTNVQNTFTLDYQVGGVDQPTIDTGPTGTDTPTEFTVDRLVDLTVSSEGDNPDAAPSAQDEELVFRVTNNGNDTQAYSFALVNEAGDDFDLTGLNITYYVDDGDGMFQTDGTDGAGTAYTPGSGAASADLPADAIIWVVVDGDIPAAGVGAGEVLDADEADVSLVADTLQPSTGASPGTAVVADGDGINTIDGAAENVLADGSGTANENANEGDHSATGTYVVASADITASKTVSIFSEDGTGCASIPGTPAAGEQFSIPGACVEYVIEVINAGGSASATAIDLSDTLADELEFIAADASGFTGETVTAPAANTDCTGGACVINMTGATLAASTTGYLTIRALVQ